MTKRVNGKEGSSKGKQGLAQIVKLDDHRCRVDFDDGEQFPIEINDEFPVYIPIKKVKPNGKLNVQITLDENGKSILYAHPTSGEFSARFEKFNAPEGQEPAPETKVGRNNKSYQTFGALFELTEGHWKGAKYFMSFYMNFASDEDGNLAVSGNGKGSDNLFDFLEATGVNGETIPYSENPLPEIQRQAQANNNEFRVLVSKGWIETIIPSFEMDDVLDDDYPEDETETHPALD